MGKNQDSTLPSVILFFHLILLLQTSGRSDAASLPCEDHSDCRALLEFKRSVTADPSASLDSWDRLSPHCNWTGVACDDARFPDRVTAVELTNNGLGGSISPFVSNLSLLRVLSLQGNSFGGRIPDSIGQLSELVHLNISINKLQGEIPASLWSCRSLKELDLSNNNLSGQIPDEIGAATSLTYLAISGNSFNGPIPVSLFNLTELIRLELAVNYLTGKIPPEIGALVKLETMYLHVNFLEGAIPSSISNCSALREVSLIGNSFTGPIPAELGTLPDLERVYLSSNRLSGRIPTSISNLSRLILFDVSLNELEGDVPLELGKLKNLENLYLHSNNLVTKAGDDTFSLLTVLTNCSFLQKLHLGSCFFSGMLPSRIGDLSKDLYYFNLIDNHLTGNIPDSIGNLSGLVNLNLGYNHLNGTLPGMFGKLAQLQRLYLNRNKLQGTIPSEIGNMGSLGLLDLGNNSIEGSIPAELGNLSQLRYLYLFNNRLSGNIPIELTRCSLLLLLDLSYNNLQGQVPTEIGRFTDLALALNLSNNRLGGEIPASIGKLVSVEVIDLSSNKLSGNIPSYIGDCLAMEMLNLSRNSLGGLIPESLKQITSLKVLDLAYNNLTGNVPMWVASSKAIEQLNLSYNRLTGKVPSTGRFKYMNSSSFLGNPGLCGDSGQMGLLPCQEQRRNKNRNRKWVYVITATVSCGSLAVLLLIAVLFYRRRSERMARKLGRPNLSFQMSIHEGRMFTLRELEIATAGFSDENLLGEGSFGSVYKAVVGDKSITVAVKILKSDCVHSQKSFKRECDILSAVRHRNLVKMIGAVWSPQFQALILEFIGNGNLAQHLYGGESNGGGGDCNCKLSLRKRMSILLDIANGLEYLHERCTVQIIHCDLKPQNVLIDEDMVARVADFGVGKLIEEDRTRGDSTTSSLRGTFGYMPPEYGQGVISTRGDVYSFGVMLLETMTRKKPTSKEFSDDLSLRKWVRSFYPDATWEAVDKSLKEEAANGDVDASQYRKCCTDVIMVGMMCTEENPQQRPLMSLVVRLLENACKEIRLDEPESEDCSTISSLR